MQKCPSCESANLDLYIATVAEYHFLCKKCGFFGSHANLAAYKMMKSLEKRIERIEKILEKF